MGSAAAGREDKKWKHIAICQIIQGPSSDYRLFFITQPFFLQKVKIFIHFTGFSGTWICAVENLGSKGQI